MSVNSYEKLREFLDTFPVGFRKTQSGVEIEILKRLFTEEEAELATFLTIRPERGRSIARRSGRDPTEIESRLESIAMKGLIFRRCRDNKILYNAAPQRKARSHCYLILSVHPRNRFPAIGEPAPFLRFHKLQ